MDPLKLWIRIQQYTAIDLKAGSNIFLSASEHFKCLINSIGRRALFSYRARYDVTEFSNCRTEERSEAEVFCAVWKRNDVIPCSITEQSTTSYVLTV